MTSWSPGWTSCPAASGLRGLDCLRRDSEGLGDARECIARTDLIREGRSRQFCHKDMDRLRDSHPTALVLRPYDERVLPHGGRSPSPAHRHVAGRCARAGFGRADQPAIGPQLSGTQSDRRPSPTA